MKVIKNTLKERILVEIEGVYYDSWGGVYLYSPKSNFNDNTFISINHTGIIRKGFEMMGDSLIVYKLYYSYDKEYVYFHKDKVAVFNYDSKKKLLNCNKDEEFNMSEIMFGRNDLIKFMSMIISKEGFFNDLIQKKLIIFNYKNMANLFFIYKNELNYLIDIFADKKLYNILFLILNSKLKEDLSIKNKNLKSLLPMLVAIENSNIGENMNVFNSDFKNSNNNIPNILDILCYFMDSFKKQDIQSMTKFIEVLNVICNKNAKEDYYSSKKILKIINVVKNISDVGYYNNDLTKILNYLIKSMFNTYTCNLDLSKISAYLETYLDYISMVYEINYDEMGLYPNNLKTAHDIITNIINNAGYEVRLSKEETLSFNENILKSKKYEYENENYIVRAPKNPFELFDEGKALNHCVGGYTKRVAKGYTNILFVRHKIEEAIPFMTLEIKENNIVQAKKKNNSYPKDNEEAFLREYANIKGLNIINY